MIRAGESFDLVVVVVKVGNVVDSAVVITVATVVGFVTRDAVSTTGPWFKTTAEISICNYCLAVILL